MFHGLNQKMACHDYIHFTDYNIHSGLMNDDAAGLPSTHALKLFRGHHDGLGILSTTKTVA